MCPRHSIDDEGSRLPISIAQLMAFISTINSYRSRSKMMPTWSHEQRQESDGDRTQKYTWIKPEVNRSECHVTTKKSHVDDV